MVVGKKEEVDDPFHQTRVRSLATNSLTPWRLVDLTDVTLALKKPTQNLLRFLLLLMLMLRKMLTTVGADLVIKLNFCSDIEHKI